MHPPIGFKTAEPAYTDGIVDRFYRPLIAAGIAPVVMSIDSAGHCYDVWKLVAGTALQNAAVMHFRRTGDPTTGEPNGMDVANYDADPVADADRMYDWHIARWPKELPKEYVWTQFTNEPRKEAHDWLARHGLQLCRRALADGRRITLFGWADGTPEPEAWHTAAARELLDLCRRYPDRLAIALNEYSYRSDTLDGPALIGRWQAIPKPWPAIFITEHGWAYDSAPPAGTGIPQLLETYRRWYAYPHIKGLALWTLDKGRGGKQLPYTMNAYMTPLAEAIIANDIAPIEGPAEPAPTPTPVPAPTATNLLKNPSFEEGWSDSTAFPGQHPAGWEMAWNVGSAYPNPYAPAQPYMAGEAVHKTTVMLPAEERGQFVWDGETTYKVFGAGTKAFWGRLKQTLALPAGRYRLTTPVWVDCYRWDTTHKRKDYNVEPRQAETMVKVNDKEARPWTALKSGQRHDVVTEFDHPGGDLKLAVHLRANWQISNNFWVDGWQLVALEPEVPPTPQPPTPPVPPVPEAPAVKVADISKWQGAIKPAAMQAAGIHAVILRASYGTTRDQNFDLYMAQLRGAALPVPAVYHYYEPARPWRQQLDTLIAAMRQHGVARPVVDLEDMNFAPATATRNFMAPPPVADASPEARRRRNRQRMIELGIDPDQTSEEPAALEALPAAVQPRLVEDVRLFLEALDREMPLPDGYAHMVYTNYSYWLNVMGKPEWGAKYQLWIAAWTTAARPAVPAPWATWTLWQHTSSANGQAHGVQSDRLDLNRFNGTAAAFGRWAAVPTATPALSLEETLRAVAGDLPRYVNPTFALPAAIIAKGQQVNSPEAQASHAGVAYTLELGLDAKTGAESVFYARTGNWQNVRSLPLKPPQPAAPAVDSIDLLPYLLGDGRLYEMKVVRPDGKHTQQVQTLREGDGSAVFYHLKNRQWEELWADAAFIYRGTDTSFSEDTYYTLRDEAGGYGSRWCPRFMRPGEVYERNPLVTFYYKRGCVKRTGPGYTEGRQRTWLQLVKRHPNYLAGGILLEDVIELRWLDKPIGGAVKETYFYARGYGLVAWSAASNLYSHIVAEFAPGERQPMTREAIACLAR